MIAVGLHANDVTYPNSPGERSFAQRTTVSRSHTRTHTHGEYAYTC